MEHSDGDDHVAYLLEPDVVADLISVWCSDDEPPTGGEYPGAAFAEDGVAAVRVRELLGRDMALAGRKAAEAMSTVVVSGELWLR